MLKKSLHKSGSALLMLLLVSSVAATATLAAAKAGVFSTQATASANAKERAYAAAQAGIEEGLYRYSKNLLGTQNGEFGVLTANLYSNQYALNPKLREMCKGEVNLVARTTDLRPGCSGYSLVIRKSTLIDPNSSLSYIIPDPNLNVFDLGLYNTDGRPRIVVANNQPGVKYTYELFGQSNTPMGGTSSVKNAATQSIIVPTNAKRIKISRTQQSAGPNVPFEIRVYPNTTTGPYSARLDKGYVSITSTGYANGSESDSVTLEARVSLYAGVPTQILPIYYSYGPQGQRL